MRIVACIPAYIAVTVLLMVVAGVLIVHETLKGGSPL